MPGSMEIILNRLEALPRETRRKVRTPYLYLDPEAVAYLFQELTGLPGPPEVRVPGGPEAGEHGQQSPAHHLFEAMRPVLEERAPLAESAGDLDIKNHEYVRVKGRLQATHFPDGALNLEILFAEVRGLLFFTESYFNSMIRPLVGDDRFHALEADVEALVYVHGPVRRTIFYHQSYGDNREHLWVPLTPVAIRNSEREEEGD
jgi:hypothetical protein